MRSEGDLRTCLFCVCVCVLVHVCTCVNVDVCAHTHLSMFFRKGEEGRNRRDASTDGGCRKNGDLSTVKRHT
jgi:hypothetical protein